MEWVHLLSWFSLEAPSQMSLSILGDFQSIRLTLIDTPGEGSHCALLSLRLHCSQAVGSDASPNPSRSLSGTHSVLSHLLTVSGFVLGVHGVGTQRGYMVWVHSVAARCGDTVWVHGVVA